MPEVNHVQKDITRVGWAGGKYHIDKLLGMKETFTRLHDIHGDDITFVFKGIHETNMTSDEEKKKLRQFRDFFGDLGISYELHPYTKSSDWMKYYKDLRELDLDIFFAPMDDDLAHEAKSELKYLESSFIGAPIIVPAIGGHQHAISQGKNGILIERDMNDDGFTYAIDLLIRHPELRQKLAVNARENLCEDYTLRKSSQELADIFSEQLEKGKYRPVRDKQTLFREKNYLFETLRAKETLNDEEEGQILLLAKELRSLSAKKTSKSLGNVGPSTLIDLYKKTMNYNEFILGRETADEIDEPLVTVITPTYQRPKQLMQAIQDMQSQNYNNFEMLVCSDGPDHDIKDMIKSLGDDRISYHELDKAQNKSGNPQRNKILGLAKGKYVCFMDDDVEVSNHYLKRLVIEAEKEDADITVGKIWHGAVGFIPVQPGVRGGEIDILNILVRRELAQQHTWIDDYATDFRYISDITRDSKKTVFLEDILGNHDPAR